MADPQKRTTPTAPDGQTPKPLEVGDQAGAAGDQARAAAQLPKGRIARTARVGTLAAGQSLRWAGMSAANRVRAPDRAAAAKAARTVALVDELVEQLGRMRGAAMKVGQMLSMVDFDGLPQEQQDELRRKLATLRDDVPPVPFARLERLLRAEYGAPLSAVFAEFEPAAFAAASIGQVHRATTLEGAQVVVKVQYPGVAEAVETDLRNATLLIPLLRRLAPGLDARALAGELRERISEELDYELEAQSQRRVERLVRGHPFIHVPRVHAELSTRRVLVTEHVEGRRFEEVRGAAEPLRDRYAQIVFRFFFGLLYREGVALGDPHPGNYLLRPDGRVSFLDYGLLRSVTGERVTAEARIARAVADEDAQALKDALVAGGYLPRERAEAVEAAFALRLMRAATGWYALRGEYRFGEEEAENRNGREGQDDAGREDRRVDPARREEFRRQINQLTLPADAVLVRRMHGMIAAVLYNLRARADWGAIAAEYLHGAKPADELGRLEAEFLARRPDRPRRRAGFPVG